MANSKKIIVYAKYIPKVGGIETITFNLCKLLSQNGFDTTLVYDSVETSESLFKFAPYVDVIKLQDDNIVGDICILTSNHKKPKSIIAKRFIQWIHSDYREYNITLANKDDDIEYVAVSKHCSGVAKELFGIDATPILNFPDTDFGAEDKQPLKLVSVTRLSPEKGLSRMLWFANKLKELCIPFMWIVCGDNSHSKAEEDKWHNAFKDIQEVSFVGYKRDPSVFMKWADYTVLLSDFEGCPLTLLESIKVGTPVITTSWGGSDEFIRDGKAGYIVPLDIQTLTDSKIKQIAENIPVLTAKDRNFSAEENKWIKLLSGK